MSEYIVSHTESIEKVAKTMDSEGRSFLNDDNVGMPIHFEEGKNGNLEKLAWQLRDSELSYHASNAIVIGVGLPVGMTLIVGAYLINPIADIAFVTCYSCVCIRELLGNYKYIKSTKSSDNTIKDKKEK